MKIQTGLFILGAFAVAIAPGSNALAQTGAQPAATAPTATDKSGNRPMSNELKTEDTKVGTGAVAAAGHTVVVHYTGWLYDDKAADHHGAKFDSSVDRKEPFSFPLGAGRVIKGWDQGVAGMKVGGKRTLTIPPGLGYGEHGAGGVIPPNAILVFDVELLDVK
jgi:FKBP-type peptidyl-prolyl cis-trans isomerase